MKELISPLSKKKTYLNHSDNLRKILSYNQNHLKMNNQLQPIKAMIVEDEINAQELMLAILSERCPNIQILNVSSNIETARKFITNNNIDLIFLDIELEDGDSFEFLELIDTSQVKLIFTTAYDQFALEAFKYAAVDYILKPYSPEDIVNAVERISTFKSNSIDYQELNSILTDRLEKTEDKIMVHTLDAMHILNVKDIISVEANQSYCKVYLKKADNIILSKPLAELEKQLPSKYFYRVHSGHLVNMHCIKEVSKKDGGYIVTEDDRQIPIARRRKQDFLRALAS